MSFSTNAVRWATLTYDPKRAESNIPEAKPELTAAVTIDGEKCRIYWTIGGLYDRLLKNDAVMVEYYKGKWKIARSQTPELMKALESRQQQAPPPRSMATNGNGNGTIAAGADDVDEMISIAQRLTAGLPDWTEQGIDSLACTIFMSRRK